MEQLKERYLAAKRRLFEKVYGVRLNPPQCRAVFRAEGPLLVLAGAGSGKTTVLVRRISYLIRYGNAYHSDTLPAGVNDVFVSSLENAYEVLSPVEIEEQVLPVFIEHPVAPWQILAITFTNKAAREIKERLARELGDDTVAGQITAGTFHSVCVRFLRQWGERVGYRPGFTIYDTDDKKRLVVDIMKELNISDKVLPPKTVCNVISNAKDNLISPDDYVVGRNPRDKDILRVYTAYQARLMEYNALDFDDIIMKTVELLENHEDALRYYQERFRYVSVDEYQDTNRAQFRLTQLLSSGSNNIMVVGDDDQSIYAFRGATITNILQFDKIYKDCHVIKLEQNYRSTKRILAAANAVIANNEERHSKNLWCDSDEGELIHLAQREDQNDEAWYVTNTITQKVARGRAYRDFAVLYRINEMARALEGAFIRSGIPYRILGGQRFYDRKEIRDMVAYLYVVMNHSDDQRLKRIVNEPKRGIGGTTLSAVELIAHDEGTSMFDVMSRANQYTSLSRAAEKLIGFTDLISRLAREYEAPSDLLAAIFERTGYHDMLSAEGEVSKPRIDAIEEFVTEAKDYEAKTDQPTLVGFMEEVALVADVDKYDEDADTVVLMTIHSAKGLEFPVVFLPGMEEGIFPGMQASVSPSEMGEERRLAYVAITRAKEELYMSYTRERMIYGRTTCNPLSRFVQNEIPEELLHRESDFPRRTPQRSPFQAPRPGQNQNRFGEMNRRVEPQKSRTASSFGIEKLTPGTRVSHPTFGTGTILSARDMGGDMLYAVAFDDGSEKKLMATFARLEKI